MVEDGEVDVCLAGASDASCCEFVLAGYDKMKAYAKDMILPYDKRRTGFIAGEGAAVLCVESKEHAQKRLKDFYSEISGYAFGQETGQVFNFDRDLNTLACLIKEAVKDQRPDYINTHGTGTLFGDIYETEQIKKVFGEEAYNISLSSTKSFTGHMLGASGAAEAAFCMLSMQYNFIPPTLRLDNPDPECDLDFTAKKTCYKKVKNALSFSMGFGGQIAVISFMKE